MTDRIQLDAQGNEITIEHSVQVGGKEDRPAGVVQSAHAPGTPEYEADMASRGEGAFDNMPTSGIQRVQFGSEGAYDASIEEMQGRIDSLHADVQRHQRVRSTTGLVMPLNEAERLQGTVRDIYLKVDAMGGDPNQPDLVELQAAVDAVTAR